SPLLPESDEEAARAGQAPREPGRETPADTTARRARPDSGRAPSDSTRPQLARSNVVRIDFDGLQQRVIAVQDIALHDYSQLRAGAPGTIFFQEATPQTGTNEPGGDTPPAA